MGLLGPSLGVCAWLAQSNLADLKEPAEASKEGPIEPPVQLRQAELHAVLASALSGLGGPQCLYEGKWRLSEPPRRPNRPVREHPHSFRMLCQNDTTYGRLPQPCAFG
eukprot:8583787-Pyramimonas_sp.AAC.1